ncbi:hypothetical protein ACLOJK_032391 [Asimina triloba]
MINTSCTLWCHAVPPAKKSRVLSSSLLISFAHTQTHLSNFTYSINTFHDIKPLLLCSHSPIVVQTSKNIYAFPSQHPINGGKHHQHEIHRDVQKMAPSKLNFPVQVNRAELVKPHTSTPREFKYLSNIDDQMGLRNHIPFIHFYPGIGCGKEDPVHIVREAVSRALVPYYPIAGRLRNADKGKLVVDCCGQGVIFREANAGITLAELRKVQGGLKPPFPGWDQFLCDDIWGSYSVVDSPLLRIQVTRLACCGFALAYTFNHCICDAYGALQFVTAVSEFARNPQVNAPSILPAWGREILAPRSPPRFSHPHPEYDPDSTTTTPATVSDLKRLVQISAFFSKADIAALKRQIESRRCPTFDAIAACLWRARTKALALKTATKLLFPIDTRFRYKPSLPDGYYGAAVVFPVAVTTAEALCNAPLGYAAGLVSGVKKSVVGDEYRQSVLDFIEANGRRGFCAEGAFVVSDMTRLRFADVDMGWGQAVYGGPGRAGTGMVPGMVTSVIGYRDDDSGADGVLALASLPERAVEIFLREVKEEIRRGGGDRRNCPCNAAFCALASLDENKAASAIQPVPIIPLSSVNARPVRLRFISPGPHRSSQPSFRHELPARLRTSVRQPASCFVRLHPPIAVSTPPAATAEPAASSVRRRVRQQQLPPGSTSHQGRPPRSASVPALGIETRPRAAVTGTTIFHPKPCSARTVNEQPRSTVGLKNHLALDRPSARLHSALDPTGVRSSEHPSSASSNRRADRPVLARSAPVICRNPSAPDLHLPEPDLSACTCPGRTAATNGENPSSQTRFRLHSPLRFDCL